MKMNIIPNPLTLLLLFFVGALSAQDHQDYPIQPVPFTEVRLQDEFWSKKIMTNHEVTIPIAIEKSRESGRIDNFKIAGGLQEGQFCSQYPFDDSDVFKIIEAASYSLQQIPDEDLEEEIDSLIYFIGLAQEEDGYLYTNRTIGENVHEWAGEKRWELVHELSHELYNLGHLYEAAVAHHQATGKRSLLDVAIKSADLVCAEFGPGSEQIANVPGHQEIEIGLIKLFRITGEERYLTTAKFFLDARGTDGVGSHKKYDQSHLPVKMQSFAVGHAVRGAYMWMAMADIAAITGDEAYLRAIKRIWHDVVEGKLYLNGGIGASRDGEAFGEAYDLPNMTAYCETCAAVGNALWNHRLFLMSGDSKYIDVLERSMYNNILSGVSISGDRFFYPNPLASSGQHERRQWFGCACCPPNVARFLPSVPAYIYAQQDTNLYVNLYLSSETNFNVQGQVLNVIQQSDFPWAGKVNLEIRAPEPVKASLKLRVPGYVRNRVVPSKLYTYLNPSADTVKMKINGQLYPYIIDEQGYITIDHVWNQLNAIQINFPFETKKVKAREEVTENQGKVAIERGPILYCAEWPDNLGGRILSLVLDEEASLKPKRSNLLNGTYIIKGKAKTAAKMLNGNLMQSQSKPLTLIPYHLWNNRGPGEMSVWLPIDVNYTMPEPAPTIARTSQLSASVDSDNLMYLIDQRFPKEIDDHSYSFFHWGTKKASTEWVQFEFPNEREVSSMLVHWLEDSPNGNYKLPLARKVQYRMGKEWMDVPGADESGATSDTRDSIKFTTIKTDALRLLVKLPQEHTSGLYEVVIE